MFSNADGEINLSLRRRRLRYRLLYRGTREASLLLTHVAEGLEDLSEEEIQFLEYAENLEEFENLSDLKKIKVFCKK